MTLKTSTVHSEPATSRLDPKETDIGSVFVSNYPPYSFWNEAARQKAFDTLAVPPAEENTLGLYLHIPFCRKRCKFCYFRVYTDRNASQIETYLDALAHEVELYSQQPAVAGRPLKFVYFGGGTPSYISVKHLNKLVSRLKSAIPWEGSEEVTFECEPGTLSQSKVESLRENGMTRLSLGIENFNDFILQENGRAHLSKEIFQVLPWIKALDFDQLNIDLIAGMVGETWQTWKDNVKKTIEVNPDSVTIYQMELPYNTVYTRELQDGEGLHVADWQTKRDWHQYAFEELQSVGYALSSAYTMVRKEKECHFVYRDSVWRGTDMLGTGVAAFGHMQHVHLQNAPGWNDYLTPLQSDRLPVTRAFAVDKQERLVREMILQLKLGRIETKYFRDKFGVDITSAFSAGYSKLANEGMLTFDQHAIELTQQGLLRVDQLLPEFYAAQYRDARYT